MGVGRINVGLILLVLAGCSASATTVPRELPSPRKSSDSEIIALFNEEPITRSEVLEKLFELERRRSIDTYLRWKVIENTRARLGIVPTSEELERRADALILQYKNSAGEMEFRAQLEAQGFTEASYRASVLKNRLFLEKLMLEEMVRYSYFAEGWIEIDRVLFVDGGDASRFSALAQEKGYDAALAEVQAPKARMSRRPREVFLRDLPPPDLDPNTVGRLFEMEAGATTQVEVGPSGLSNIVHVRKRNPPSSESVDALRARVFEWVLEEPPADAELAGWIDLQLKRSKIEYADRGSQRN